MRNLFFIFLLIHGTQVSGQFVYFKEMNTQNGLPTDCVYDLAVDDQALMYLGTDQGVYTFNGVDFKQFVLKNAVSSSITSISFTDKQILWCRNFSDQVFYSVGSTLKPSFRISKYLKNELLVDVRAMGNLLYVLSFDAIYVIQADSQKLIKRIPVQHAEGMSVEESKLLITNVNGLCMWIKGTDVVRKRQLNPGRYRSAGSAHESFIIEKTTVPGLAYQVNEKTVRKVSSLANFSHGLYINNCHLIQGTVFLTTNLGTFIKMGRSWTTISNGQNHTDLVTDFQGGIWIGTIDNGLIYVPSLEMSSFFVSQAGSALRHVIPGPRGFFVSTNNGILYELDKNGRILEEYDTKTGRDLEFIQFDSVNQRIYTSVGHFQYGSNRSFVPFYYGKGLAMDRFGNIYFGIHSLSGIIQSGINQDVLLPNLGSFTSGAIAFRVIRNKRTRCLHQTNDYLMIGYVDKLLGYSSKRWKEFKTQSGKSIHAVSMATDRNGRLWVATVQDGVYVFQQDKQVRHFSAETGLSNSQCKRLKIVDNQVYVITINGLDRIDPDNFDIRSLTNDYSLQHRGILDVDRSENCLLLVTKNHVIRVPFKSNRKLVAPKIQFKKISTRTGEIVHWNRRVTLDAASFEITWEYLAFREGVKIPLFYRLRGLDTKWRRLSPTVSSLAYNGLTHGNYIFEIRSGVKQAQLFSLPITIEKPFWLTWWFISGEVLIALLILFLTIRLTVWYVRKKQRVREQLILSQLTAIRSQMNPHFLYNVLNSLQGLIYSNKVNEAGNYVSMFSDHLRHTLDMSDKQLISVQEELESLEIYLKLEKLRFGEEFQFTLFRDPAVDESAKIPSMIVQPFVENAVKHGLLHKKGDKHVHVSFTRLNAQTIEIVIRDNGIGREKAQQLNLLRKDKPKSFATGAILNRIDLLNAHFKQQIRLTISDLSVGGHATGTEVSIQIPLDPESNESINRR